MLPAHHAVCDEEVLSINQQNTHVDYSEPLITSLIISYDHPYMILNLWAYFPGDGWWKMLRAMMLPIDDGKPHTYKKYMETAAAGYGVTGHYHWEMVYIKDGPDLTLLGLNDTREMGCNPDPEKSLSQEPINTISGSMLRRKTDFVIPCPGIDLEFRRSYNSTLDYTNGPLGPKWVHTYDWHVCETSTVVNTEEGGVSNCVLLVRSSEGPSYPLHRTSTNCSPSFVSRHDVGWTAQKFPNGEYEVTFPRGLVRRFGSNGLPITTFDPWGNTLTLAYTNIASGNRLRQVRHSNGQALLLAYSNGLLSRVETPSTNLALLFFYNPLGQLTNAVRSFSAGDYSTTYAYDPHGNHCITQAVGPAGDRFSYSYSTNASGDSTSRCAGMALLPHYYRHSTLYTNRECTLLTYNRGGTDQTYYYHHDTNTFKVTKISGPNSTSLSRTYSYSDLFLNVTEEFIEDSSIGESATIRRAYDTRQNVTEEALGYCSTPANTWSHTWHTNYDDILTSVTDPEEHKLELEYTNTSLSRTKLYFDSSHYHETLCSYTTNGLLSAVTNANGHWIRYTYDGYGRLNSVEPQAGPTVTYSNSVLGHIEKIILPGTNGNRVTTFDADELGRVTKTVYPNNVEETFAYDALGNLANHVDTGGRTTIYEYAPGGNITSITKSLGGTDITTSFTFDNQLNTLRISDPKGRAVESYSLDIQDRAVTITNLEMQSMTVTYGLADYVRQMRRFDETTVSNAYDGDGWLHEVHYPDGADTFTYYANGLLKTAINETGIVSNQYNRADRLILSAGPVIGSAVSYSYLPAGQVSNVASVAGDVSYSYDKAERVSLILSPRGTFTYSYNTNNGLVSSVTCTNSGVTGSYGYDELNRITAISWKDASDKVLNSFVYTYNAAGMTSELGYDTGEALQYGYDDLDRLTSEKRYNAASECISTAVHEYDEVGNRIQKAHGDLTVAYDFPYGLSGNRLGGWSVASSDCVHCADRESYDDGSGFDGCAYDELWVSTTMAGPPRVPGTVICIGPIRQQAPFEVPLVVLPGVSGNSIYLTNSVTFHTLTNGTYAFDEAGCLTNIAFTGPGYARSTSFDWNSRYELTCAKVDGETVENYRYDAIGRRVSICAAGSTNLLVHDGVHVVAEVDTCGVLRRSYVHGPGIDNILAMTVNGAETNTYYYLRDRLGSTAALVDESGQVVEQYRYNAWGRVRAYDGSGNPIEESAVGNRYLWQGREYSWKTGLYYFRARWYDPVTARWLSKDPIGITGGVNQYVFGRNNPANFSDPFGLCADPGVLDFRSAQQRAQHARRLERWARVRAGVAEHRTFVEQSRTELGRVLPPAEQIEQLEKVAAVIVAGPLLAMGTAEAAPAGAAIWTVTSGKAKMCSVAVLIRLFTGTGGKVPEMPMLPGPWPAVIERVWPF